VSGAISLIPEDWAWHSPCLSEMHEVRYRSILAAHEVVHFVELVSVMTPRGRTFESMLPKGNR
jgi:hypothetical protein